MGLSVSRDLEDLVAVLDDHPTTVEVLASRLTIPEEEIRDALAQAEAKGWAVDWGHDVWATTWRAKLGLHPGFFHVWLPASLGIGLVVTALALWLNGPPGSDTLVLAFAGLAVVAGALSLRAHKKR